MLPFFYNVYKSSRGPQVTVDDPWGWGRSLEWATSCPPPRHNFVTIPRIRSESPAFDLHHPEVAAMELRRERPGVLRRRWWKGRARMKTEAWIFGICGIFVWLVTPLYWVMSKDWTGTSALVMTALLATMVFGYLFFHANRLDPRPEDRSDAEIADGAGELGFFPPYSWWPLWCALCLAVMVFAVAMRGLVALHHRRDHRRLGAERPDLRVLQGRARALSLIGAVVSGVSPAACRH